jgi:hypothetical protein
MAIDILKKILEDASAQSNNMSIEPKQDANSESENMSIDPNVLKENADSAPSYLNRPASQNASENGANLADNLNFPNLKNLLQPFPVAKEKPEASAGNKYLSDMYAFNNNPENVAQKQASNEFLSNLLGKKDSTPLMLQGADQEESPISVAESSTSRVPSSANKPNSFTPASSKAQPSIPSEAPISSEDLRDTEFEQAQEVARKNRDAANFNDLMASLSNALIGQAGSDMSKNKIDAIGRQLETANQPLTDLETKRKQYSEFLKNKEEKEKNDPNSSVSKSMRDALSGMGVKIPNNATYATMEKLAPQLMKNKEFQLKMQELHQKNIELAQNREALRQSKLSEKEQKTIESIGKSLSSFRGDPAAAKASDALRRAEMAERLLNLPKWSSQERDLFAGELSSLVKGGVPTEHEMKSIVPDTGIARMSKAMTFISGKPQDVSDKEYKKRMLHYLNELKQINREYLDKRGERLVRMGGYDKLSPEGKELLRSQEPGIVSRFESSKSGNIVVTPLGEEIQMVSPEAAQAFKKEHPEIKIKGE